MFELSFAEILIFSVVALIVLGPEKLPVLARFAGRTLAKIQNMVHNVKAELGAEMGLQELEQMKSQLQWSAQNLKHDLQQQADALKQDLQGQMTSFASSSSEDDLERAWTLGQQVSATKPSLVQQSRQRRRQIRLTRHSNASLSKNSVTGRLHKKHHG